MKFSFVMFAKTQHKDSIYGQRFVSGSMIPTFYMHNTQQGKYYQHVVLIVSEYLSNQRIWIVDRHFFPG
jgi:hypothetical protein